MTLVSGTRLLPRGSASIFKSRTMRPPTYPLHPILIDMPRPDGMTAYAGTILVQGYLKTDLILICLLGVLRLKPSSH
jgi:hypothetical protein